jgi:hypothetical protein
VFKTTPGFREHFRALSPEHKRLAKAAFAIFKANPQDMRLRPHKINALSARLGKTIRSVVVANNLRVVFYIEGNIITSLDIGTHDIYGRG